MKAKLTLTIERDLIPKAKNYARGRGVSLSQLVEGSLARMTATGSEPFSRRWQGRFKEAARDDNLYRELARKHL